MELRQLRYFAAVAHQGHFRSAAQVLSVTQPGLSQQVRQLERELGAKLFDRTTREVRLTPAGELLLNRADALIADVESIKRDVAALLGRGRDRLRVGTLPSGSFAASALTDLCAAFNAAYPSVQMSIHEDFPEQLFSGLVSGAIDLAFIALHGPQRPPAGIAMRLLLKDQWMLLVAPDHPWAKRTKVAIHELEDQPLIVYRNIGLQEVLESYAKGVHLNVVLEAGGPEIMRTLASRGSGVGVCPSYRLADERPRVAAVRLDPRIPVSGSIMWAKHRPLAPAQQAFLDLTLKKFEDRARQYVTHIRREEAVGHRPGAGLGSKGKGRDR